MNPIGVGHKRMHYLYLFIHAKTKEKEWKVCKKNPAQIILYYAMLHTSQCSVFSSFMELFVYMTHSLEKVY